ncbi:glycosyltransferase [Pseudomonadales bacterium]|nr:glycosyltransferase [Pseudomonadales bacterium]
MIDIVISTYNRAGYLGLAINSVLRQNNDNYNLYILDNCSTDNTKEVVESFTDSKMNYIKNDENLGMVGNWNKALITGNSQYVHIFHDDDLLEPDFIDNIYSVINENSDCVFIHSAANIIDEKGRLLKTKIEPYVTLTDGDKFFADYLRVGQSIVCPSVVINRSRLPEGISFSEKFPFTADINFYVRISKYGNIGYVNSPSLSYRTHQESGTSSIHRNIEKKIQDRMYYRDFLIEEISDRGLTNLGAAENYLKFALIADIWFTRSLGGSYFETLEVAFKCSKAVPSIFRVPRFYVILIKAMFPISLIKRMLAKLRRM